MIKAPSLCFVTKEDFANKNKFYFLQLSNFKCKKQNPLRVGVSRANYTFKKYTQQKRHIYPILIMYRKSTQPHLAKYVSLNIIAHLHLFIYSYLIYMCSKVVVFLIRTG